MWVLDGCWGGANVRWISSMASQGIDNASTFKGQLLTNKAWHTSIVQVRNSGVTTLLDGKMIAKVSGNFEKLSISSHWKLRDVSLLGLAHSKNVVEYSTVELIEISGTGKKTR